jgi:uncharacterized membrane protein SpoIIM required for sporulation
LSRLYRSICYDLSLVQSREWGARLEQYLNDLVAQGHNCLYRTPPKSFASLFHFFAFGFPRLLRRRWIAFLIALALFAVPLLICTAIGVFRSDVAEFMAGKETIDAAVESYGQDLYTQVDDTYSQERGAMFGFYVNNNTGIALRAFAFGALAGIGTCLVLLSNGISIGLVQGAIIARGGDTAERFFSFVITHGSFELTAIVIAGAAGLILAQGIMIPGNRTRLDALRFHAYESLQLALGAAVMLGIAAVLEGYFSPLPIESWIKYTVGTIMWLLVISYIVFAGRERRVE